MAQTKKGWTDLKNFYILDRFVSHGLVYVVPCWFTLFLDFGIHLWLIIKWEIVSRKFWFYSIKQTWTDLLQTRQIKFFLLSSFCYLAIWTDLLTIFLLTFIHFVWHFQNHHLGNKLVKRVSILAPKKVGQIWKKKIWASVESNSGCLVLYSFWLHHFSDSSVPILFQIIVCKFCSLVSA